MSEGICIVAIDPGLMGAIAFFWPVEPEHVELHDMPTVAGEVDVIELAAIITRHEPRLAIIEKVGPTPRDGVRQAWSFGGSYMAARGVTAALALPTHLVTPQAWKKLFRLPGGPDGKEKGRAMAMRLFPAAHGELRRKKDHNRAEAALLARYGAERLLLPGSSHDPDRVGDVAPAGGVAASGHSTLTSSPSATEVPE